MGVLHSTVGTWGREQNVIPLSYAFMNWIRGEAGHYYCQIQVGNSWWLEKSNKTFFLRKSIFLGNVTSTFSLLRFFPLCVTLADHPVPSADFLIEYYCDLGHAALGPAIFFILELNFCFVPWALVCEKLLFF